MKKVGIALGGGGAKGLSHALMLEVIDEFGITPTMVAGTSIGAVVGVLYASGRRGADLIATIEDMSLGEDESIADAVRKKGVLKWFKFIDFSWSASGLLKADAFLDSLMEGVRVNRFEDLKIPLNVVAADFWKRDQVVFDSGDIRSAVHASMAIPGIFSPVVNGERVLVDGGVVNPLPYDLLKDTCDFTIAIDVMGNRTESEDLVPSLPEAVFNSFSIMQRSILRQKIAVDPPDIYIAPDIVNIQMLEFYKAADVFRQARPAAEELRRQLDTKLA